MTQEATEPEIAAAGQVLRQGGLVAFPTETVYGLGANALNADAVARIFEVKNRPAFDPLIVHICEIEQVEPLVAAFPDRARALVERYWPGPLSIVLPKNEVIPDIVTAGNPTVALRIPDHPVALALIRAAGVPVAAPSANLFGRISPTTTAHVAEQLGDQVDAILDGGPSLVGLESTIVSFTSKRPLLLRPGGTTVEEIEAVVGPLVTPSESELQSAAPGRTPEHYAPLTRLTIHTPRTTWPEKARVGLLTLTEPSDPEQYAVVEVLSATADLREAATRLFAAMRRLDRAELDLIVADPVPETGLGRAIMDRLRRAAAKR